MRPHALCVEFTYYESVEYTIIILPITIGIIITGGVAVHLRTLFAIIPQLFINVYRL